MINFNQDNWEQICETYTKWWNGELERPLIKATVQHERICPFSTPLLSQATCHRLDISPEDLIDRINFQLEGQDYLGDAFPMVNFDFFGPGIVAAFCGAILDNTSGRVWFRTERQLPINEIHVEFDPKNKWLNRIKDIYHAGHKKWKGNVLMSMADLSGILDIAAVFCGTDQLLIELYDNPDEVKRLIAEIETAWMCSYQELNEVLHPMNPGYSDWVGIYSAEPYSVLQSDFTYMISPDMCKEFAIPSLKKATEAIPHTVYHLDGKGEIPHLPQLLSLEELDVVQWIPGDGAPAPREWLDKVYRPIAVAGKKIQVLGDPEDFDAVAAAVGSKGLYHILNTQRFENTDTIKEYLNKYI